MSWFKLGKKSKEANSEVVGSSPTEQSSAHSEELVTEIKELASRSTPDRLADLFLVMEEHLNEIEMEEVADLVDALKQPPPLVERLTSGLDDPEELREAILSSPTLSADVLRVVNSAAFALSTPISSIEHAVNYLGTTMVKGLVLQSAITQVMNFETDVQKSAYMRIWRSSYVASAAAQAYAQALDWPNPSVFATRALLVNVGDLALISARPDLAVVFAPKSTLVDRVEAQQQEMMSNSALLSSLLAKQWGLPKDLYDALRFALTPMTWAPSGGPDSEGRSDAEAAEALLLYIACRIGDAVAYQGVKDLDDFALLSNDDLDLFLLPAYLQEFSLQELVSISRDRKHNRRAQQAIANFSG
ncbi:MAG: HDOD domain-containing protein [Pseudomonadota bacterium]